MFFILALGGPTAHAGDKIVLSSGVLEPYTTVDHKGFLDQLLMAVFRDLGLEAEVIIYPTATERGMLNANEGVDDGLAMRVAGLEKQYPNLIRVPEPVAVNDFVAYTTGKRFTTDSWVSLEPYVVTYIIGWKVFEQNVPQGKELTLVRDADQLFGLLKSKRADVALYERWQGLVKVRDMGFKVQVLEPPLVRTNMYMYLHKKHAALVPKVSQALAKIKQDGRYQHIVDITLTPFAK
ncbi:transporter substrate-binding domain-containing protein [Rhodoferax sp.]|uniref:substrate-binding periplasmic protein n=1 Tax=Rhodoferax sp. TaxID=50421 RepID=UPI0026268ACC|nr:transporter substrate-binding domain-containing protein [Rhodoferax sp.]MDD2925234.1 transporter substrate-binding domain-containing protein [Rhodoferax sp.]